MKKTGMETIQGPYLLLVTHSSMVDFNIMLVATEPNMVNNVMTLEGFNTYTEPLMRSLGVLGTRKYISDLNLIKNIRYCIEKLKNLEKSSEPYLFCVLSVTFSAPTTFSADLANILQSSGLLYKGTDFKGP